MDDDFIDSLTAEAFDLGLVNTKGLAPRSPVVSSSTASSSSVAVPGPGLADIAELLKKEFNMTEPGMATATIATVVQRACIELEVPNGGHGLSLLAKARACWQMLGSPPLAIAPSMTTTTTTTLPSSFDPGFAVGGSNNPSLGAPRTSHDQPPFHRSR